MDNVSFQEYSVQITFREDWIDPRLEYDDLRGKEIFILNPSVTSHVKLMTHALSKVVTSFMDVSSCE